MIDRFKIMIKPDWDELENIRNEFTIFIKSRKFSIVIVDTILMILSELIENAIKYGNFKSSEDKIICTVTISKNTIICEVTNPFNIDENFKELDKTMQWIRGFQNPVEAYISKIKEIAERPLEDRESGLGLVRIAYQGQSIIDFYLKDDDTISVSAVYEIIK